MAATLDILCDLYGEYTPDELLYVERKLRELRDAVQLNTHIECGVVTVRDLRKDCEGRQLA
jgi:hypothetical protein